MQSFKIPKISIQVHPTEKMKVTLKGPCFYFANIRERKNTKIAYVCFFRSKFTILSVDVEIEEGISHNDSSFRIIRTTRYFPKGSVSSVTYSNFLQYFEYFKLITEKTEKNGETIVVKNRSKSPIHLQTGDIFNVENGSFIVKEPVSLSIGSFTTKCLRIIKHLHPSCVELFVDEDGNEILQRVYRKPIHPDANILDGPTYNIENSVCREAYRYFQWHIFENEIKNENK